MLTSMRMFEEARQVAEEAARSGAGLPGLPGGGSGVGGGGAAAAVAELMGQQAAWSEQTANYEAAAEMYIKVRRRLMLLPGVLVGACACMRMQLCCAKACCCLPSVVWLLLSSLPPTAGIVMIPLPLLQCAWPCTHARRRASTSARLRCWCGTAGGSGCCRCCGRWTRPPTPSTSRRWWRRSGEQVSARRCGAAACIARLLAGPQQRRTQTCTDTFLRARVCTHSHMHACRQV